MGGTFDPPHLGHLELAKSALKQLKLDKVLWVLTGQSPFKTHSKLTDAAIRLEMLKSMLEDLPLHELSKVDLERPAPHYTSETLQILHQQFPKSQLYFLMGSDSLRAFPNWNEPEKIVDLCEFAVWKRPESEFTSENQLIQGIHWIEKPPNNISSSEIRKRIFEGSSFHEFITGQVGKLISLHQLYQSSE